tara:strand:- start:636 stop:1280 length:645 start_codon:yes stop_codon:yes gene_type:complete
MNDLKAIQNHNLIETLYEQGFVVLDDYVPKDLFERLSNKARRLYEMDALQRAGIGRDQSYQKRKEIRQDSIHWLDKHAEIDRDYLALMENLRLELNRAFFLGLFEYEAHYARYPQGGFYKKHLDSFKDARSRVVSTVSYLNEDWTEEDGGQLVIYDKDNPDQDIATILPKARRIVVFFSEEMWHEVKPAQRPRYSIAGWYRLNTSHENVVNPLY